MQKLLEQHCKRLPLHDLKILLKWIALKLPGVSQSTVFMTDLWDEVGMKLWDAATKGDKAVVDMLPSWRAVSEALKAQKYLMLKVRGMLHAPPPRQRLRALCSLKRQERLFHPSQHSPQPPCSQVKGRGAPHNLWELSLLATVQRTARKEERRIPLILRLLILTKSQIYFPPTLRTTGSP